MAGWCRDTGANSCFDLSGSIRVSVDLFAETNRKASKAQATEPRFVRWALVCCPRDG